MTNKATEKVSRRRVLEITGASTAIATLPTVVASKDAGTSVQLVQVGVETAEEFDDQCTKPIPENFVGDEVLTIIEPTDSTKQAVENNDTVVYSYHGEAPRYRPLPAQLLSGKSRTQLSTKLSEGMVPVSTTSSLTSIPFPPVRIESAGGSAIVAHSGTHQTEIAPGETAVVCSRDKAITRPPESRGMDPEQREVTENLVVRNNRALDVEYGRYDS